MVGGSLDADHGLGLQLDAGVHRIDLIEPCDERAGWQPFTEFADHLIAVDHWNAGHVSSPGCNLLSSKRAMVRFRDGEEALRFAARGSQRSGCGRNQQAVPAIRGCNRAGQDAGVRPERGEATLSRVGIRARAACIGWKCVSMNEAGRTGPAEPCPTRTIKPCEEGSDGHRFHIRSETEAQQPGVHYGI
jgi:hypothetical protein